MHTLREPPTRQFESRWPAALTILALLLLLAILPGRTRFLPTWVPWAVGLGALAPMGAVSITRARPPWPRIERTVLFVYIGLMGAATLFTLAFLLRAMIERSATVSGLQLLTSSIAVWATNVLIFSLVYWLVDQGGPEARANGEGARPDWHFPQVDAPDIAPPGWRPTFVDYLFLGFSTATAFSTTEALPMTPRAKLMMMLESVIALVTLVTVASRAINILGN